MVPAQPYAAIGSCQAENGHIAPHFRVTSLPGYAAWSMAASAATLVFPFMSPDWHELCSTTPGPPWGRVIRNVGATATLRAEAPAIVRRRDDVSAAAIGATRFVKTKKVAAPVAGGGIERPEFSAFRFTVYREYEHAYAS